MKARIALFTANVQGGILQLTVQLYKTLVEEGYEVKYISFCQMQQDEEVIRQIREVILEYFP